MPSSDVHADGGRTRSQAACREVIARVRAGERLLLTVRGRPVAIIAPIDQQALDAAVAREAWKVEEESWLALAEDAFAFWDNDEDAVWDRVAVK